MPTYQEWIADQNAKRSTAQGRLSGAQAGVTNAQRAVTAANNPGGVAGGFNSGAFGTATNQLSQAGQTLGAIQGQISQYNPESPENLTKGRNLQAYDLAHGGINRLANDPTDQFIRGALQKAAGPDGGPYDATTRNAMFTGAMESSGATAQVKSIMDSAAQRGLSVNDPTVQAALRNAQGQQAQAGQRARLGVDTVANPTNYAAQQSAVNRLGDYNTGKQQQTQSAEDRLRQMLMDENSPRASAAPQISTVALGGGSGQQPAASSGPWMGFSQQGSAPDNSGAIRGPQTMPSITQQQPSAPPPAGIASGGGPANYTMRGPAGTVTGLNGGVKPVAPVPKRVGNNLYSDPYGY